MVTSLKGRKERCSFQTLEERCGENGRASVDGSPSSSGGGEAFIMRLKPTLSRQKY